jgi:hypothetical protein
MGFVDVATCNIIKLFIIEGKDDHHNESDNKDGGWKEEPHSPPPGKSRHDWARTIVLARLQQDYVGLFSNAVLFK